MRIKRRNFLQFLGASAVTMTVGSLPTSNNSSKRSMPFADANAAASDRLSFSPVRGPIPLDYENIPPSEQPQQFATFEVVDDIVLPEGFTYDVIGSWGDRLADSRFGYNNDYLSFIETSPNEGFLTINFEYISGQTWMQTYAPVIGKSLPFDSVKAAAAQNGGIVDAWALPDGDPLKAEILEISKEALIDQGIGAISIRRNANGKWERTYSKSDRRITGISGLEDGRYLRATGPATAVFRKSNKMGYDDGLNERIIGTIQNCAGGTTPWGTVMSAEENFQDQVHEPVMPDGSAFNPSAMPFFINDVIVAGRGNPLGLAGNKYGYMVEVDPANPQDYGTKHTWLGRFRHEAVAVNAMSGKPLALYSGCDRRGGHVYKFVSNGKVKNPQDKANSRLMEDGMLYAAIFEPNGRGRWIPLKADTPVNPVMPSSVHGGMVTFPKRPEGGIFKATSDAEAQDFQSRFRRLGDLYAGSDMEKQGAILIDAHFAANAAGATCTARPEDTNISQDGTLYIAFTSGSPGSDGGPDKQVFSAKDQQAWEHGWIMKVKEDNNDPASMTFEWEMLAMGGEPADGGAGFSNPDNLELDKAGNVWMVTDISTSKHNIPDAEHRRGVFGNNSIWMVATSGPQAGNAYLFATSPMECETCGPMFSPDQQTLFLAIQHPGERNGIRQNDATETREFTIRTTTGEEFSQQRTVPIGSNWPDDGANQPPRPSVVAVRRVNAQPIL
jgi:secreted PhoX family phosphatase